MEALGSVSADDGTSGDAPKFGELTTGTVLWLGAALIATIMIVGSISAIDNRFLFQEINYWGGNAPILALAFVGAVFMLALGAAVHIGNWRMPFVGATAFVLVVGLFVHPRVVQRVPWMIKVFPNWMAKALFALAWAFMVTCFSWGYWDSVRFFITVAGGLIVLVSMNATINNVWDAAHRNRQSPLNLTTGVLGIGWFLFAIGAVTALPPGAVDSTDHDSENSRTEGAPAGTRYY